MIHIVLNDAEIVWSEQIAHLRQHEAVKAGLSDRHGCDGKDGFKVHRYGTAGELAACISLDLTWPASVNTFKEPDIILRCTQADLDRMETFHRTVAATEDHLRRFVAEHIADRDCHPVSNSSTIEALARTDHPPRR